MLPLLLLSSALAEEWHSDEYHCSLVLPDTESWQRGNAFRAANGELIFSAKNPETKQSISVIVLPDFPTSNLNSPATLKRLRAILREQGFEMKTESYMEWNGHPFIEIVGVHPDDSKGKFISVARATIIGRKVYYVSTSASGDESALGDDKLMRVINSFRFINQDEKLQIKEAPLIRYYQGGYVVSLVLMCVLVTSFFLMYFRTRARFR